MTIPVHFELNGQPINTDADPAMRLSNLLRDSLGKTGTKVGCDAGDCGACSVIVDGAIACACMVPAGQIAGSSIETVEGLAHDPLGHVLQAAFLARGAAQCGICTPGMLLSAIALLRSDPHPDEAAIADALGGVLCRCTGYRKIIEAVLDVADGRITTDAQPEAGQAVGARIARLDGQPKVDGGELYGADGVPADALWVRAIRSPYHHAGFSLGDLDAFVAAHPGLVKVLTAKDIPGRNLHGVIPAFADQPVFARDVVRFKGEAVAAVVGRADAMRALDLADFPVIWAERPALLSMDDALASDHLIHSGRAGNVLVRGRVARGNAEAALADCDAVVSGTFETGFVEHAYVEPEAGWARRVGDRIEIIASTQSPYMDRDDVALILGIAETAVRIIPSACGGGFGSKLDLSVQPYVALAAWLTGQPCAMVYTRPESIASTTKRHPARITSTIGAKADGTLLAMDFAGDFNTGAYSSWGPTVANRVPVHASGPYVVPNYRALSRAVLTHSTPAGAFRGFGVPQTVIVQEQLLDELALKLGLDPLEFRIRNALTADQPTVTGQIMGDGVGFRECLEVLRPAWKAKRAAAEAHNAINPRFRRGVGVAGMFYGCGNTSLPNPSTMRLGITPDGRVVLHQGAVDIGQGSNTIMVQIAADASGLPISAFERVSADTDLTPDCGKTSASRQTFVSGKAAELAGRALRARILRMANAGPDAIIHVVNDALDVHDGDVVRRIDLSSLPKDRFGYVLHVEESFDPPTAPLDADGQGKPYAVYGYGAHLAEIEVDVALGTVKVLSIVAAHDVGRAINPVLVEGQIEGGVAQGIGMALMEEFVPGRGENLHDYLIPTIGDVPPITSILVESPSSVGPFGAKGIGEQALIPTAPAIFNAIHHATGVRVRKAPATPDRLRSWILEREQGR